MISTQSLGTVGNASPQILTAKLVAATQVIGAYRRVGWFDYSSPSDPFLFIGDLNNFAYERRSLGEDSEVRAIFTEYSSNTDTTLFYVRLTVTGTPVLTRTLKLRVREIGGVRDETVTLTATSTSGQDENYYSTVGVSALIDARSYAVSLYEVK